MKETKFEQLYKSNPKGALKEIDKFESTPFWEYFKEQMNLSVSILKNKLRTCDIDEVENVRAKLDCNELLMTIPDRTRESILDEIEFQKDAKKVEDART